MLGAALVASCQPKREDLALWELEQSKIELQERLNLLNYRLQVRGDDNTDDLKTLQTTIATSSRRKQELLAERNTLAEEIASLENAAVELELAWIQQRRVQAAEASFERFVTRSGRVLENASVTRINDGGVSIRHDHGSATLRFDDLTAEQQQYFGLTETRATAAENRELLASANYERQIEQQLKLTQEQEREANSQTRSTRGASAPLLQASRVSTSSRVSPLARPATSFGGRTWSSGSYYNRSNTNYRTYYYYPSRRTCNPFYNTRREIRNTGLIVIPNPYK